MENRLPLFFGVDKHNELWIYRAALKSDFPGNYCFIHTYIHTYKDTYIHTVSHLWKAHIYVIHIITRFYYIGPMYPIGFQLIQKVESYIEAEDELDIVVSEKENFSGIATTTTATTTTTTTTTMDSGLPATTTTSIEHTESDVVMGEEEEDKPTDQVVCMATDEGNLVVDSIIDISTPMPQGQVTLGKTRNRKAIAIFIIIILPTSLFHG